MGTFDLLMNGFAHALTPQNLLFAAFGVLLGTAIGVLPGIGPAMAVALLLPVTYAFDPTGAFIMFAGIYFGAMFGGSTTSILLNTPGESASVMAAIEGNPMAKSGRGAQALATAAIGHFIGGIVGVTGLVLVAPLIASVAVDIGAPDYFAIMVLAFVAVSGVLGLAALKLTGGSVRSFLPSLMLPNSGNMGLPLVVLAFGDQGMRLGVSYFFVVALFQYSVGMSISSGTVRLGALARQPLTGVYGLSDPTSAIRAIAGAQGVSVYQLSPWVLVISGG